MGWAAFRIGFGIFATVVFAFAIVGILLTGPVVIRTHDYDLDVDASPDRLRRTVERLCVDLSPRRADRPENLRATADWIEEEFTRAGLRVERRPYRIDGTEVHDVLGWRRAPRDPAGTVAVVAHYDVGARGPGADDNASGVAALLELVRTLPETAHTRTQVFAAIGRGGDPGLARRLAEENADLDLAVSLDTLGYYADRDGSQSFPWKAMRAYYPRSGNFVAIVGDAGAGDAIARVKRGMRSVGTIPVYSFRGVANPLRDDSSDHRSFAELGIPAVWVTDTASMRNPYYRTEDDTPATLDYSRLARLVEALHGVLAE